MYTLSESKDTYLLHSAAAQKQPVKGYAERRKMEVKRPEDWEQEEGFTMLKGGKGYTIADIEALPEGERAELIDGELFWMDTPTWTHQDILMQLSIEISLYIRKRGVNAECSQLPSRYISKKTNATM